MAKNGLQFLKVELSRIVLSKRDSTFIGCCLRHSWLSLSVFPAEHEPLSANPYLRLIIVSIQRTQIANRNVWLYHTPQQLLIAKIRHLTNATHNHYSQRSENTCQLTAPSISQSNHLVLDRRNSCRRPSTSHPSTSDGAPLSLSPADLHRRPPVAPSPRHPLATLDKLPLSLN